MSWPTLVEPLTLRIREIANGPYMVTHLEDLQEGLKSKAIRNPDSYAWFVTEAFWTLKCGYLFEEAEPDPEYDSFNEDELLR
ncbi:hypothetical protein N7495_009710 [Penicillium taxi]|uniref:uncharacterized protein n=1 Tax=Penicillium taxi TaxID=168475 RepID=UPI0025453575|nr:uncharacterized protein N7495_009710 [Penicillium taxi]KAJ5885200.1 hypothetical protein N7495_009710 [Penicillium taxi]